MGKNQSASNLTNIIKQDASGNITFVSGSTTLMSVSSSGAITTTGVISGSNALSASYAVNATSASYAATSSYASAFNVAGTLTATTLVVQTITSSVDFVTGSTRFGSLSSNTHVFTGSIAISGSGITINGTGSIIGSGTTNYLSKFTSAGVVSSSSTLSESGNFLTQAATGQTLYIVNANTSGDSGFQMRLDGTLNAHLYTDRTNSKLTLGTLTALPFTIETNNTERMRITSSGSVGIGCTPGLITSLDIQNPSVTSNNVFLRLQNNIASEDCGIIISGSFGIPVEHRIGINTVASSKDLTFSNSSTAGYRWYTDGTQILTISSAGLVTKPYQTYFIARGATTLSSTTSTQKLPYGTVDKNIGSAYNGTTYTFTAPVTGIYQFNWQMFVPPSVYLWCHLYVNDVASHSIEWNNAATANYQTLWGGMSKSLNANDTVYLGLIGTVGYQVHLNQNPGPGSFFSGYLLG